ncbi:hypothetical protein [Ascidiimonas sp. W6]|uniref:hypothetical protein n=1 Tax=Ascidiimonas meishanensis TaxID=3128903 RepID=UPI0030EDEEDF
MNNENNVGISSKKIIYILAGIGFFIFWRYLINVSRNGGYDNYFNLFCYLIIGFFPSILCFIVGFTHKSNSSHNLKSISKYNSSYPSNSYSNDNLNDTTQEELKRMEKEAISKGILAPGKRGQYIDKKTGEFKRDYFFSLLNNKTKDSIDLETGKYQTKDFFGFKIDTGKKIDIESGIIYKKQDLGYEKTKTRVNQVTGRIEKKDDLGIFWNKTDERINPKTGKREKKDDFGIFWNEVDE